MILYFIGTRGPRKPSPSPDHSVCEPPTIVTKRVKSPEKDLAATINIDSNICTLKRLVFLTKCLNLIEYLKKEIIESSFLLHNLLVLKEVINYYDGLYCMIFFNFNYSSLSFLVIEQ